MKIKVLLYFFLTLSINSVQAQFNEDIVSARPGITNGPFSVGKGVFQLQTGVGFERWNVKNSSTKGYIVDNNTVLRIGIFERTEIRGAIGYNFLDRNSYTTFSQQTGKESLEKISNNGIRNSSLGIRQNITKQSGLVPSFGLQLTAQFGGTKNYKLEETSIQLRMLLQYKLFDKLILNTNITGNTQNDNFQYTFSCGYLVSKKFRVIAEVYGTRYSKDSFFPETITTSFNVGAGYLLTNNLQVDLFGGLGNDRADVRFASISAGISYRVHKREK